MSEKENITGRLEMAARLQEIRKSSGLTQEAFAEKLELSVSAYKKLENATNQISTDNLRKIARKFNVSIDYIVDGKRTDVEEAWKMILNCAEDDKLSLLIRLRDYFTRVKEGRYPVQDEQPIYDEKISKILEEMGM